MSLLYFDCFAGISGDMILGALIDLGLPMKHLTAELGRLGLGGYSLRATRVQRSGITGRQLQVKIPAHGHEHRSLADIEKILRAGSLSPSVRDRSIAVFRLLARAEGRVHNQKIDRVHFHEVGAIDSIVDIAGSMIGFDFFGFKRFASSALPVGAGFVDCRHGRIPLPAPATVLLLKGIPVYDPGIRQELVTPTGAAILAGLCESFGPLPPMIMRKTGYGAGYRELKEIPNLLRLIAGDALQPGGTDTVTVLEASIDDMSAELAGYAMERLFASGALDVAFTPVFMKKNRPGMLLTVICTQELQAPLTAIVFSETTTAGVRSSRADRSVLARRQATVATCYGPVKVKLLDGAEAMHTAPEYEDCRRIARKKGVPLRRVYEAVCAAAGAAKPQADGTHKKT